MIFFSNLSNLYTKLYLSFELKNDGFSSLSSLSQEDASILKEQLRKAEDQIQASKQEAVLMSKELSDAVNVRDKTMSDLHSARLENEKMKKQLADTLAELKKITALKNEQVSCQYLVLKFIYIYKVCQS